MMREAFAISVDADVRALSKSLTRLQRDQLPFAISQALTATAKLAQVAEKAALPDVFDRPTPFTINSVAVKGARKSDLEARVFVKDIAAAYLEPYEFGGDHKLIGRGKTWLNPKDKALLNQYGNFSRNALQRLEARPDVFVGTIKTKGGESIGGVWQRPTNVKAIKRSGKRGVALRGVNKSDHLKLLIRFGDAEPVRQHLEFGERAFEVADEHFGREFERAMARAVATAKL
ncbi:hypothetical protein [Burkholderia sp. IDO3]|uniref:hypothetical protein n=1 Tax=Burkholderia sp. IDO3 TaxID=1705310 RepID=UPI000BBAE7EE|nr:hypothetical protein [Burkholderia sp. IDO3]AXK61527.1 hypothetical protein DCN14_01825 [Burkholderia sp. IDO3]PCD58177.1 hypothetical protein CN645_30295 [Burkholderia sp. IDO3]